MANPYELKPVQHFAAPNGRIIHILSDGSNRFVQFKRLYQALGYSKSITPSSVIALVLKNQRFKLITKKIAGISSPAYVLPFEQTIPLLESFIRASLMSDNRNIGTRTLTDNARMEAQRLIEIFNREVFGKTDTVITRPIETPETLIISEEFLPVKIFKSFTSPNGTIIEIWQDDSENFFVQGKQLFWAVGYEDRRILEEKDWFITDFVKQPDIRTRFFLQNRHKLNTIAVDVRDVSKVLDKYINRKTWISTNPKIQAEVEINHNYFKQNTYSLINWFKSTVIPTLYGDKPAETKEDTQMENFKTTDKPAQGTVPVVTVADIEDIGDRASYVAKVYGVSLKESLIAATKLKAEEINRDLSPLLEMLA